METKGDRGKVLILTDECTYKLVFGALLCAGHNHSHVNAMLKPVHFHLQLRFGDSTGVCTLSVLLPESLKICEGVGTNMNQ